MTTRESIDLNLLDDNPFQPRTEIDPKTLELMADSIRGIGLLQAPMGRRMENGRVQIAYGHRRIAACKLLRDRGEWGPAIDMEVADVGETTDQKMAVMAIAENVARQRLTQIEVVRAHRRAIDETGLSIQGLADELGVSRSALSNNLRVLELPDFILEHVESGRLRVNVAREFLVLQNATHAHIDDMQAVVNRIANSYGVVYRSELPNWSRKNVRDKISEQVATNEPNFRPLGPKAESYSHYQAGAVREATFDTEAFAADYPDKLHTVPNGDKSRVWTCEVDEWRRRQTRATREANEAAKVSGTNPRPAASAAPSRDKQFERALAQDPVFQAIKKGRAKAGANRPLTDEERAALGTRAELQDVDYGSGFWKILAKGDPAHISSWRRQDGGAVPPYFPLEECANCVAGAAYAKSRRSYILDEVTLVCLNRQCYQDKCGAGGSRYREELEAHRLDVDRIDARTVERVNRELEPLSVAALRTLATVIVDADARLDWQHPFGEPYKKWSWETGAAARIRELLRAKPPAFIRHGRQPCGHAEIDPESLPKVADGDLRELVSHLVVHHLRQSGKLATVSRETAFPDHRPGPTT